MEKHAIVIEEGIWTLESKGALAYLTLAASRDNYARVTVQDLSGNEFLSFKNSKLTGTGHILDQVGLIPQTIMVTAVKHEGQVIGQLIIHRRNMNIYVYFNVLVLFLLVYIVIMLFLRIVYSRLQIEDQVKKRTSELRKEIVERKRAEEELKLDEYRFETLLKLNQMTDSSLHEIVHFTMEEAVRLTKSKLGYIAFVDNEQTNLTMYAWSKTAMNKCQIREKPIICPIKSTGLWGEAIRQRRTIITNDYAAPNPYKKGYPDGHVEIVRHMNIPIIDNERIVLLSGVGNKDSDYDNSEVRQLTLLMTGMWRIVHRKKADEALKESKKRFNHAMTATKDGLWDWEIKTDKTYFSPGYYHMLGYAQNEFSMTGNSWLNLIHDEDREKVLQKNNDCIENRIKNFEVEYRMKSRTGEWKWILDRGSAVNRDENGKALRMVGTHVDITDRKRLEKNFFQSQKMESIGTLAGGIAHDFNNILGAIMGYTELCIDDVMDRPETHQSLKEVLRSANRAKDLVSQILTFSRSKEIEKKPIKTIPIVNEVCKFMQSSLPTTIKIRQEISTKNDQIMFDPTQFHQVLMNLCTNAFHAMKKKGGVLEVLLEEAIIEENDLTVHLDLKTGSYLKLIVKDTGYGISKENLDRIFEPYFTTKGKGEGTGLGLAVVHGIVKECRGDIKVYSKKSKGTSFQVLLPLLHEQPDVLLSKEDVPIPTGTETVMFVDDEELLVETGKKHLERLGYKVTGVTGVEEALEIFKHSKDSYDIVITDKNMPNMTGFVLTQKLKKICPEIPVILCTGFKEKDDDNKAQKVGVHAIIEKPINKLKIAETIRAVLDKK